MAYAVAKGLNLPFRLWQGYVDFQKMSEFRGTPTKKSLGTTAMGKLEGIRLVEVSCLILDFTLKGSKFRNRFYLSLETICCWFDFRSSFGFRWLLCSLSLDCESDSNVRRRAASIRCCGSSSSFVSETCAVCFPSLEESASAECSGYLTNRVSSDPLCPFIWKENGGSQPRQRRQLISACTKYDWADIKRRFYRYLEDVSCNQRGSTVSTPSNLFARSISQSVVSRRPSVDEIQYYYDSTSNHITREPKARWLKSTEYISAIYVCSL